MWRLLLVALALATPAFAQVAPREDTSILEQLVPESFRLTGTATAARNGFLWRTTINYALTNNSGMNLFLGIDRSGVSLGSCTEAEAANGGLPLLPRPRQLIYGAPIGAGPPRGILALAGARIAGTIILMNCDAPNPGYETAPLALSLMLGKEADFNKMQLIPLSAVIPIRQLRPPF
jgi:hypothetical protein